MKRLVIAVGVFVALFITLRRVGPKVAQGAMKQCEEMMSQMGDDFPPKQMMERMQAMRGQTGLSAQAKAECIECAPESTSETAAEPAATVTA